MAFLYFVNTVAFDNISYASLYQNLQKARRQWGVLAKVLTSTGATVHHQEIIYKAVVQKILLYGIEIWVVMGSILKVLEGLYHQLARRIVVKTDWHTVDRDWECIPVSDSLDISELWPIKEYIQRHHTTIEVHISCRPIYKLGTGEK